MLSMYAIKIGTMRSIPLCICIEGLTAYPLWQYPMCVFYQKKSDAARAISAIFYETFSMK